MMDDKDAKPQDMTVEEALNYYTDKIERGEPSDDDNILNKLMKTTYYLGDGDFQKGAERLHELKIEQHEHEMRINPALAFFEELQKSENPVHRMFAEFLLQGGMSLPTKDAIELQDKLLREENFKSAKQLPASVAAVTTRKMSKKNVSKRGRQTPTDKVKLDALKKWNLLDKSIHAVTLRQFLKQEFGENIDGSPSVAEPTFHGWRLQLRKKDIEI